MKTGTFVLIGLLAAAGSALAQWTPPRTYGSPSGFGNILFPGMGTAPPIRPVAPPPPMMMGRPGFGGRPVYGWPGARPVSPLRGGGANTIVVPYAVPVVVNAYDGMAPPEPGAMMAQPTLQPAAPPVIINQHFLPETARPVTREYGDELPPTPPAARRRSPAPPPADEPIEATISPAPAPPAVYLIAFKDHSVYSAIAYWVEEDSLNYITPKGIHNRATMNLVDEELSRKINGDRNIDFRLSKEPAKR